jgi:hypothetical protein
MKYKCIKCNKEFKQKGHYDYHIKRKYSCNDNYDENNVNIILPQNTTNLTQNTSNLTHNTSNLTHNTSNLTPSSSILPQNNTSITNTNNLLCKYCNKTYSRIDNLNRHINNFCKKNNKQTIDELIGVVDSTEKLRFLEEENEMLKEELEELRQSNTQLCKVSKGKIIKKNTNSHNVSNNTNNTNNNTNTNSHNQNNINNKINNGINNTLNGTLNYNDNKTLVNFGYEDVSIIAEDEILGAINTITDAYSSFVTVVHANQNHPQFSNLKIPNLRSKYGMMLEEGKFVTKTIPEILDELKNNRLPELINYVKMFYTKGKLPKQRYDMIIKKLEFIQTTYPETEDIDGNIIKCSKEDLRKLKDYNSEVVRSIYDKTDTISSNINVCDKNKLDQNKIICNV